ncbi:hypothetical protein GV792_21690 [Nocardia cyriacigeorgica]|uniref:hypothetical protein n=1 Tax=Nocardia cyriacigeorgica TaxID=135487 RepID=UPI0013B74077|nr:hypothetical protein [Nocardia cyriacigeorgica]NEW52649.1 hypothetical protein [Nocardia cyriacigeorgica]
MGALTIIAASVAAPAASAFPAGLPTGSFGGGDGREVVMIDGTMELSNLDQCWASGFPREIEVENRSSRNFLLFASNDCTGAPVANVAPHSRLTHHGWSAKAA